MLYNFSFLYISYIKDIYYNAQIFFTSLSACKNLAREELHPHRKEHNTDGCHNPHDSTGFCLADRTQFTVKMTCNINSCKCSALPQDNTVVMNHYHQQSLGFVQHDTIYGYCHDSPASDLLTRRDRIVAWVVSTH